MGFNIWAEGCLWTLAASIGGLILWKIVGLAPVLALFIIPIAFGMVPVFVHDKILDDGKMVRALIAYYLPFFSCCLLFWSALWFGAIRA
ncbi:MAG: hypothetical protein QW728_06930 [Thermoplasmata archaeon]